MHNLENIGDIVRDLRKQSQYNTQEKFAEKIGTTAETVSNIERGRVVLNTITLVSIAENFDVSTDYLLGIERDEKRGENL